MNLNNMDPHQLLVLVMTLNVVLSALYKGVETLKDKTNSQLDNKLYSVLGKSLGVVSFLIQILSANPQHDSKPSPQNPFEKK